MYSTTARKRRSLENELFSFALEGFGKVGCEKDELTRRQKALKKDLNFLWAIEYLGEGGKGGKEGGK